jgi:hypothetical protein
VKRIFVLVAAGMITNAAMAQDNFEDYDVVLPDDAQKCVLPASPDAISENASLDELKKAKADIAEFQGEIEVFRSCLQEAEQNPDNTAGNKQAIVQSYNYSVEMEERVAERFNAAVRDYKERKAAAES